MREFITRKGKVVRSTLSDEQALALLRRSHDRFGHKLLGDYARRGTLSSEQWKYVHKIAMESLGPVAGASMSLDLTQGPAPIAIRPQERPAATIQLPSSARSAEQTAARQREQPPEEIWLKEQLSGASN
jgi:hypothetical protein